jgi:hypothetical protein
LPLHLPFQRDIDIKALLGILGTTADELVGQTPEH